MNEIAIPAIPAGVLVIVGFFSPFAAAVVISPRWPAAQKKVVAIITSVVLAAVAILFTWLLGQPLPSWPVLILLVVVVSQASYALVTKKAADTVGQSTGFGSSSS